MLKHSGAQLPPGSTILIGAASGGLGTAVAQLGRAFDMGNPMIGTCSPNKFGYVSSIGVEPIDRSFPNLVEKVRKFHMLTNGYGVDVAYDGVCSEESLENSPATTKGDAEMAIVFEIIGNIAGDRTWVLRTSKEIFAGRLKPPRITLFGLDTRVYKKAETAEFHNIAEKGRRGKLVPVVLRLLRCLSREVQPKEK